MSDLRDQALALAEAGFPIFPVEENGKRPACANGYKDATTDLDQIRAWWDANPNYNIGFCPHTKGLAVIDIDPGGEGEWAKLLRENGEHPATYTVGTPRGGRHYYFEGSIKSTASKLGPHIDTRGEGGYVLVPPSIVGGKPYEVVNDTHNPAPLPAWIAARLSVRVDRSSVAPRQQVEVGPDDPAYHRTAIFLRSLVASGDVAIEGSGGNDRTFKLAAELLGICPDGSAVATLLKEIWNPACKPPWTDDEIDTFVANGINHRQEALGDKADAGSPASTFAGMGAKFSEVMPAKVKVSRFAIRSEDDMDNRPEPTWIIKDLIPDDSIVLWLGASQSFKSFLLLDAMLGVAAGVDTFGAKPEEGLVIYGAIEDLAGIELGRRKAWRSARGINRKLENFRTSLVPYIEMPGDVDEWLTQIDEYLKGRKLKMIAIDTAGKALGGESENDSHTVRRFWQVCDKLRETFGCTVVAIHHSGKDIGRGARGSSAWLADFDTVIECTRPSKDHLAVEVKVVKHKNAADGKRWALKGRAHAGSLVFDPIPLAEFEDTVEETTDKITPKKVAKALSERKAHDKKTALSTPEVWMAMGKDLSAIELGTRNLERLSSTLLRAYCEKTPDGLQWYYERNKP